MTTTLPIGRWRTENARLACASLTLAIAPRLPLETLTGSIIVSINPYRAIEGLYTAAAASAYNGKEIGALPPHVFALGDAAYRSMLSFRQDQALIISGESGAGKTEATKLLLQVSLLTSGHRGCGGAGSGGVVSASSAAMTASSRGRRLNLRRSPLLVSTFPP